MRNGLGRRMGLTGRQPISRGGYRDYQYRCNYDEVQLRRNIVLCKQCTCPCPGQPTDAPHAMEGRHDRFADKRLNFHRQRIH